MNNFENIKEMDMYDLAEFLCGLMCHECCETNCPARHHCSNGHCGMRDWLESEVDS